MMKKRKKKCDDWEKVKGTTPKNGACYAHQYMTIDCIDIEWRFTLDVEPLLPLANSVTIAEKLIVFAKEKRRNILFYVFHRYCSRRGSERFRFLYKDHGGLTADVLIGKQ